MKSQDKKGKDINAHVTVDKGRIEDLLRLAVKADQPPLTGAINFKTKFDLPPGPGDLSDRLNLKGLFHVGQAQFTSPEVTAKIETLSRKAQGQPENKNAGSSVSELKGNFVLDNGVISFLGLTFTVTGAQVALDGKHGLDKEDLDFYGKLRMEAKISQTTTGVKSFLLKVLSIPFSAKTDRPKCRSRLPASATTPPSASTSVTKRKKKASSAGCPCSTAVPAAVVGPSRPHPEGRMPSRQPARRRRYSISPLTEIVT